MPLRIRNKDLLKSVKTELPPLGEVVVAFKSFTPIFAVRLDLNHPGTEDWDWFEVTFGRENGESTIEYRLIEGDESAVQNWAQIPYVFFQED